IEQNKELDYLFEDLQDEALSLDLEQFGTGLPEVEQEPMLNINTRSVRIDSSDQSLFEQPLEQAAEQPAAQPSPEPEPEKKKEKKEEKKKKKYKISEMWSCKKTQEKIKKGVGILLKFYNESVIIL